MLIHSGRGHGRWPALGVWVLLLAGSTGSVRAAEPPNLRLLTPPTLDAPTQVGVDLFNLEILGIREQDQVFRVGGQMLLRWFDPRQAFDPAAVGSTFLEYQGEAATNQLENEVWWPDLAFVDAVSSRDRVAVNLTLTAEGEVFYRERFDVEIKQDFFLRSFPFDEHFISFTLQPFTYIGSLVELVPMDEGQAPIGWEPSEWSVANPEVQITSGTGHRCVGDEGTEEPPALLPGPCTGAGACPQGTRCVFEDGYSALTVGMGIRRESSHYMGNIILPLILILLACGAVFFMDLEQTHLGDRLGLAFTGLLTVVAFDFVASDSLPKLWYSTTLDRVITASYVFISLSIAVLVLLDLWALRGDEGRRRARAWTRHSRWLFPAAYLFTMGFLILRAM